MVKNCIKKVATMVGHRKVNQMKNFLGERGLLKMCSEIKDPYSNCSQSVRDSWFVSFPLLCQHKCKIVDTLIGGASEIWRDRDRCSEIDDCTIPYSNCSQSIRDS